MKIILVLILFAFSACNKPAEKNSKQAPISDSAGRSEFHTDKDTVIITTLNEDTLKFSRIEFNEIVDNFPALYSKIPIDPDLTFYSNYQFKDIKDDQGKKKHLAFTSEAGQDEYYILYAYFLRNQFNLDKYDEQRRKLTKIFNTINEIYGRLNFGGTYFGHQYSRITGYAEYAIYLYSEDLEHYDKRYDITKQKGLYISSLKQFVKDELSTDYLNETVIDPDDRRQHEKDLYQLVDELSTLITDYFYLKKSQEFQHAHYR